MTVLNVGNPQCAVFVDDFDLDWRSARGGDRASSASFPNRTNVSFVRAVDRHAMEVRFWERGAGETMSSGTGSTGAAYAAILARYGGESGAGGNAGGHLDLRMEDNATYLTGPAEFVGDGEFYLEAVSNYADGQM